MSKVLLTILLLVCVAAGQDKAPRHAGQIAKPETTHLSFVKEYIRELTADEDINVSAAKELSEAKTPNEQFSTGIYVSKSRQLELRSQIGMLKSMHLHPPYESLIPGLIAFYRHEIELDESLIDLSSKFLTGPKPGVDYQALAAKLPQLFLSELSASFSSRHPESRSVVR